MTLFAFSIKKLSRIFITFLGLVLLLSFQNCGPGFKTEIQTDSTSLSQPLTSTGDQPARTVSGTTLQFKSFADSMFDAGVCGIDLEDQLVCWGQTSAGARVISGAGKIFAVTEAAGRTCVISLTRQVLCWLGFPKDAVPIAIPGMGHAVQITGAGTQICVLNDQAQVFCLKMGLLATPPGLAAPVEITALRGARKIAISLDVCAIMPSNGVRCGSLDVPELSDIVDLKSDLWNGGTVCAQSGAGVLKCLTATNDNNGIHLTSPTAVPGLGLIKTFSVTGSNPKRICALQIDDRIMCVGDNSKNQIDNSSNNKYDLAVQVMQRKALGLFMTHQGVNCLLNTNRTIQCWGAAALELGFDEVHIAAAPYFFPPLNATKQLIRRGSYTVDEHLFTLRNDGTVYCKTISHGGDPDLEPPEMCPDTGNPDFVPFYGLKNIVQLTSDDFGRACALFKSGKVTCWGNTQPGERVSDSESALGVLPELQAITQMTVSQNLICFLSQTGEVTCLMPYEATFNNVEYRRVKIAGLSGAKQIATDGVRVAVLMGDGTVNHYQVNNFFKSTAAIDSNPFPIKVANVAQLSATGYAIYLLDSAGRVWEWYEDGVDPHLRVARDTGITQLKTLQTIDFSNGELFDGMYARICGFNFNNQLKCWGDGLEKTPSLFQNTSDFFFGTNYVCSVYKDVTQCLGMKPYRSQGDFLGQPLPKEN